MVVARYLLLTVSNTAIHCYDGDDDDDDDDNDDDRPVDSDQLPSFMPSSGIRSRRNSILLKIGPLPNSSPLASASSAALSSPARTTSTNKNGSGSGVATMADDALALLELRAEAQRLHAVTQ